MLLKVIWFLISIDSQTVDGLGNAGLRVRTRLRRFLSYALVGVGLNELGRHDLRHIRSHILFRSNHSGQNIPEMRIIIIIQKFVVVEILLQVQFAVLQQALLQFYGLPDVHLVDRAVLAVPEMRGCHVVLILNSLATDLHGQLHLSRETGGNLKQDDSEAENVSGCGCLEELDIHLVLAAIVGTLIDLGPLTEFLHYLQMLKHVRRQMIYLLRDVDFLGNLNLDDGAKTQEFESLDAQFVQAQLDEDVFGAQVPVHGADVGHTLQELAGAEHEFSEDLFAF